MAVKTSWSSGDVLTAADLTDTFAAKADVSGSVIQIVAATDSTATSTTSTSYVDTGLTATITPSSATSKILVIVQQAGTQKNATTALMYLQLVRDATSISEFWRDGFDNGSQNINVGTQGVAYLDSPATTSATTYKTQMKTSTGIVYTESSSAMSTIILMEVGA